MVANDETNSPCKIQRKIQEKSQRFVKFSNSKAFIDPNISKRRTNTVKEETENSNNK